MVICAEHAALQERPEAFNRVRVDLATDVFALRVIDRLVAESAPHGVVGVGRIGRDQFRTGR